MSQGFHFVADASQLLCLLQIDQNAHAVLTNHSQKDDVLADSSPLPSQGSTAPLRDRPQRKPSVLYARDDGMKTASPADQIRSVWYGTPARSMKSIIQVTPCLVD